MHGPVQGAEAGPGGGHRPVELRRVGGVGLEVGGFAAEFGDLGERRVDRRVLGAAADQRQASPVCPGEVASEGAAEAARSAEDHVRAALTPGRFAAGRPGGAQGAPQALPVAQRDQPVGGGFAGEEHGQLPGDDPGGPGVHAADGPARVLGGGGRAQAEQSGRVR